MMQCLSEGPLLATRDSGQEMRFMQEASASESQYCLQFTVYYINNSVNKAKLSCNFPHWCSTIVSLETYICYAFQNWLCKHLWSVLNFCWLFYTYSQAFNPLHPKTSMHNLHIVLYTFPKVLTGRICLPIKRFLPWWPFLCILITWVCNSGFILLGEIRCQSLLGLKG